MEIKDWLDLIKTNPIAFGLDNGFNDLNNMHNTWLRNFILNDNDYTLQAHRGSYKTTCLAIAMAIMLVIYPDKIIILVRKTDSDVKETVALVQRLLQTEIFNSLSFALWGTNIIFNKLSAYEVNTNLKASPSGASQLTAIGSKGSITGKHADIVITDDIINLDDRFSKAERDRTKRVYQELENVKNKDGRFINTGTPWHKDDAFILMPEADKYPVSRTNILSEDEILDKKSKMSESLFSANYLLEHISDEDKIFKEPKILSEDLTHLIYNGIAHIDAGYSGKDYTALTIINYDYNNNRWLVYGKVWGDHINNNIHEIEVLRTQYMAGTIYMESNADKGLLAEKFKDPKDIYHENLNKHIKISNILQPEWNRIYFIPETDNEYLEMILDYNENAEHDDAPDSLASIIRIYKFINDRPNNSKIINTIDQIIN